MIDERMGVEKRPRHIEQIIEAARMFVTFFSPFLYRANMPDKCVQTSFGRHSINELWPRFVPFNALIICVITTLAHTHSLFVALGEYV